VLSCDDPLLLPAEGTAFPVYSKSPSSVFHWKNYCETPASPAETAPHGRLPSDTSFRPEASPCHILPQRFSCQGNDFSSLTEGSAICHTESLPSSAAGSQAASVSIHPPEDAPQR